MGPGSGLCIEMDSTGRPRITEMTYDEWFWRFTEAPYDSLAHVFFDSEADTVVTYGASSTSYIY